MRARVLHEFVTILGNLMLSAKFSWLRQLHLPLFLLALPSTPLFMALMDMLPLLQASPCGI